MTADATVREAVAPAIEAARSVRERRVGFRAETAIRTRYREESALTNLVADMMRAATPNTDVALMNSGGVRTDLAAGDLDYGTLYSVLPFDNRLVTVRMRGSALRKLSDSVVRAVASVLRPTTPTFTPPAVTITLGRTLSHAGGSPEAASTMLAVSSGKCASRARARSAPCGSSLGPRAKVTAPSGP